VTTDNVLTREDYLRLRGRYHPKHAKIIFVLESPPKSGLYFYNPDGLISEPLFRAMMKDVLEIQPKSKHEGLTEFAAHGYLLIDATYTPVNGLSSDARDAVIEKDFPLLVEELHRYADSETKLVLVKVNVCRLLEPRLVERGFSALNRGTRIPFPSTGQQNKFRNLVRPMLGLDDD
jgi:hypothetical protein